MSSSRWPLALLTLIIGIGIGAAGLWFLDRDADDTLDAEAAAVETTVIAAEERDLRRFDEWAGTLQPGPSSAITAATRGTLTRTVDVGTTIVAGDAIAEIDGTAVVALYGSVPQFRELSIDSDPGADIRQLEENLVALGFDPTGTLTVDDTFTTTTATVVEAWETELGLNDPDGIVAAGQIAFIAGPSEVTSRTPVGAQANAGQEILGTVTIAESGFINQPVADEEATDPVQEVDPAAEAPAGAIITEIAVDEGAEVIAGRPLYRWESDLGSIQWAVDVDEAASFDVGRPLEVELPDGQVIDAAVTELSDVARAIQDGGNTVTVIDVTVEPNAPIESIFTAGPVTIRVETDVTQAAVLVPVSALIALAEGGHAIEVEGRGLLGVDLGAFDDGWVEIVDGTIVAGESVVVPS